LYAAQVALSGVARTHGRIGKTLVAQMLKGSTQKKLKNLALDRLSTFGLLKKLRTDDIVELLEFLIDNGYADQIETTKFRPVVQINDNGKMLMLGELDIDLTDRMSTKLVDQIGIKLKGKQPHLLPTREDENEVEIPAEDAIAAEETGSSIPAASTDLDSEASVEDPAATSVKVEFTEISASSIELPAFEPTLPGSGESRPNYFWTWRLFHDGYSIDHVCAVRNLEKETVFEHMIRAAENKLPVETDWLIDPKTAKTISNFVSENSGVRMPKMMAKLPKEVHSNELLLFMKSQ
jgi:ATP-dependent DNA helicase RecQ